VDVIAEAKELKKGDHILYNGEILRLAKKEVVVYGTHSHTKLKLYLKGLTGGGEKVLNFFHGERVEKLDIIRKTGQVLSKGPDSVQIMDTHSFETLDGIVDKNLLEELQEGDEVIFINHNNWVKVLEKK